MYMTNNITKVSRDHALRRTCDEIKRLNGIIDDHNDVIGKKDKTIKKAAKQIDVLLDTNRKLNAKVDMQWIAIFVMGIPYLIFGISYLMGGPANG